MANDILLINQIEHCYATWILEDFEVLPSTSFCIKSSRFSSGASSKCIWYLGLEIDTNDNGIKNMYTYLYRCTSDGGPEKVDIEYRIGFKQQSKEVWPEQVDSGCFKEAFGKTDHENVAEQFNKSENIIICEIIVRRMGVQEIGPVDTSPEILGMKVLATDFQTILLSPAVYDIKLQMRDAQLPALRAILSARSPVFRKQLNESCDNFDIPEFTTKEMSILFIYLYSGFDFILPPVSRYYIPLIGLYECAKTFGVTELARVLSPDKIYLRTKVESKQCEFTWRIQNFELCNKIPNEYFLSPEFDTGFTKGGVWFLRVSPDSEDKIQVDIVSVNRDLFLEVKYIICLLDFEGKECGTTSGYCNPNSSRNKTVFLHIGSSKQQCLPDDTLTIRCQLTFCEFNYQCKLEGRITVNYTDVLDEHSSTTLSRDLETLFARAYYSDMTVCADQTKLKVHSFIIAARSPFLSYLMRNTGAKDLNVPGVCLDALKVVIKYIYSGRLDIPSTNIALKVYEAAYKFHVGCLQPNCSKYLQENLNIDIVCWVLMLADVYKDNDLKMAAINYICSNSVVMSRRRWLKLRRKEKELGKEVLKMLTCGFRIAYSASYCRYDDNTNNKVDKL